ncbi:hypothetical protein Nepgr_020151 [Nepenthes gracilis]|uniref:Uncharacterized protein n=1 Tax=Nepenthes gracilis TaxID=150966 RepID=A0AAD3SWC8_NEPGR|nr:hypothetical protein Nepgr_020151 [Nepenthes gracilis]
MTVAENGSWSGRRFGTTVPDAHISGDLRQSNANYFDSIEKADGTVANHQPYKLEFQSLQWNDTDKTTQAVVDSNDINGNGDLQNYERYLGLGVNAV